MVIESLYDHLSFYSFFLNLKYRSRYRLERIDLPFPSPSKSNSQTDPMGVVTIAQYV